MLQAILNALSAFVSALLRLFGMSSPGEGALPGGPLTLRVFIKYAGRTISVDLDPSWTIKKVKSVIAPKLDVSPEEIKIIFAGNELPDSFVLETSDVGQQSYLHAVRVRVHLQPEAGAAENLVVQSSTRTFSSPPPPPEEEDTPTVTQSDFFVYCTTCEGLQEGKLRVRCAHCLSGAFTVSRHPQGWPDVLTPRQIPGHCESCPESQAAFYFKCVSHVTSGEDDSSPPLSQVKRNEDAIPCLACGEAKDLALVFPCTPGHACCLDCFKTYLLFKLNQRDFVQDANVGYTVGCPALCPNSLIGDAHHFKLMGREQYERYQRFATEECLLQMGGIFCPQPDCGMGIIPEDVNCNKIACLHGCGYVFCKRCLEGWHLGACGQHPVPDATTASCGSTSGSGYVVREELAAQAQWGDANKRALRLSTKPCPNCRVPTERAGGCMHMECTKCKFQWCWVCQTKWNRECMGNHWFG